jgi:hypothetical protein
MKNSRKIQARRKSKIPKYRMLNTSKKSKTLKTQKGGSAEMLTSIQPLLESHPFVKSLIEKIFIDDNIKYFKLDGSMPDPFITKANEPEFAPSFYLEWYKSKNPEFKTHSEMETQGIDFNTKIGLDGSGDSIYETVMAQICRDILIMLKKSNRNMNNNARDPLTIFTNKQQNLSANIAKYNQLNNIDKKLRFTSYKKNYNKKLQELSIIETALLLLKKSNITNDNKNQINAVKNSLGLQTEKDLKIEGHSLVNLHELLMQCEGCIRNNYIYKDVFEIIMNYILWLSARSKPDIEFKPEELLKHSAKFKNTPFLIFPTYAQISFNYIINLIAAPIINFRLVNRKRTLHGLMGAAFVEFDHDILGHGGHTHCINILVSGTYKIWFENMSLVISTLYPYFNYKKPPIGKIKITELGSKNYDNLDDEDKKKIIAIILFIWLHEDNIQSDIFYRLFSEVNKDLTTYSKQFKTEEDWPKNIKAESGVSALKAIFNKHQSELNEPMKNLVDILNAQKTH